MCDRAKVVATNVLQVVLRHIVCHWNDSHPIEMSTLREQVAETLRDEFADLARQVANERNPPDNEEM